MEVVKIKYFKSYMGDPERRKKEVIPGIFDPVFKSTLTKVKGALEEIITTIDDKITKEDMKEMKIINSELVKETVQEKGKVSDLVVEIKDKIINLEMNRVFYEKLLKRNSSYACKVQSLYEDKYIIQINIDNFSLYDNESGIIKFQMLSDKDQIDKTYIIKYHVNLEVIENKYYNKEEITRGEKILLMLRLKERGKLIEVSKGDELLEKIYEELDKMSKDKKSLLSYSKYELEIEGEKEQLRKEYKEQLKKEAYEEAYEKYHRQGLEEGIKEGSHTRNIEIAKNMLSKNMDIKLVSEITGLSIEEIKK